MLKNDKVETEESKSSSYLDKVKQASQKGAEKISKEAPKIATTVARKSKEVAKVVAETTKTGAAIAKTKLQIVKLKRQTDKCFKDLGKKVYDLSNAKQTDVFDNEEVKQFISKIVDLEEQTKGLQKKLKVLR